MKNFLGGLAATAIFGLGALPLPAFTTTAAAQSASCPIKLGGILPLSGTAAAIGKPIADAAQMAVDDANAAGGVKDCKVEFILRDDLSQPQTGVDAAKQLVEISGVPALVGTVNSSIISSIGMRWMGIPS